MDAEQLIQSRNSVHGNFIDNASISQQFKVVARAEKGWNRLGPMQKESLDYIFGKISRILSGDPNCKDHWDDIAGYATLISRTL